MAIGILALFGGFLLVGILASPDGEEEPAAETGSPSPAVVSSSAFPTGTFVSDEGGLTLEFRADGTCVRAGTPCTFGTSGRLPGGRMHVEMTFEDPSGIQRPAAYWWRFDGEQLTFESRDGDPRPARFDAYVNHVYRPVGETSPMPPTESDFPTGWFVSADDSDVTLNMSDRGLWWVGDSGGAYVVDGELFTTAAPDGQLGVIPATYYWDWDGERLTFRAWGAADSVTWPEMDQVWVRGETVGPPRRLLLSDPRLEFFVTVEIQEMADGSYTVAASVDEDPLGEGAGDTPQTAVAAALEELGEPLASDLAEKVPG
jgi:hypothetical protein